MAYRLTVYIQNWDLNDYYFHQIMASLWMLARLFQFDLDFPIIADPIIARENWLLTPEQEQDFFCLFTAITKESFIYRVSQIEMAESI